MSAVDANQFLRDYRNFIMKIEKPEGGACRGSLFHHTCAGGAWFDTLLDMVKLVEDICDQSTAPKAVVDGRSFVKTSVAASEKMQKVQKPRIYSPRVNCHTGLFRISLRHRYSASWQGWIEQIGTNHKVVFHSFLELIEQIMIVFPEDESACSGAYGRMLEVVSGRGVSTVGEDGMQWYRLPGASYQIKVLFHENHSCQGIVRWLEAKESVKFRSFLELAKLTDVSCAAELECGELQLG